MMSNNNIDFQNVLLDYINKLELDGLAARIDFFKDGIDDLVINAMSGGKVDREFMDGTREVSLPFEIALKMRDNQRGSSIIWTVHDALSQFDLQLPSTDCTYSFLSISVDKPAMNGKDEQKFYIYSLIATAKLELQGG